MERAKLRKRIKRDKWDLDAGDLADDGIGKIEIREINVTFLSACFGSCYSI